MINTINVLEEKIRVLKNTLMKWVEYLKPIIIEKMKRIGLSVEHFHNRHMEMIREIAKERASSPEGNAAASAIQVHTRMTIACEQLSVLRMKQDEEKQTKPFEQTFGVVIRNHHRLY